MDVDLDTARSSAQRLEISQSGSLSDVPVRYMTCDASAFEVGDCRNRGVPVAGLDAACGDRFCGETSRVQVIVLARFGYNYWWVEDVWFPGWYYEVAVQNNVQVCRFDPRTGEIENHATHYVIPVSKDPVVTYWNNPFL